MQPRREIVGRLVAGLLFGVPAIDDVPTAAELSLAQRTADVLTGVFKAAGLLAWLVRP